VDGDNIPFMVTMQMGGNSMTNEYTGAVSRNEMKLKVTRPGRDGSPTVTEVTAKRKTGRIQRDCWTRREGWCSRPAPTETSSPGCSYREGSLALFDRREN
jgi:hypothetical protein